MSKILIRLEPDIIAKILFSKKYFIMALLFPFFKTDSFQELTYLNQICNIMIAVESLIFFFLSFSGGLWSRFCKTIIFFEIWTYFVSPILFGHNPPSLFYSAEAIGMICFIELGFSYAPRRFIDATSQLFTWMIFLNFFTMIFIPDGFGNSYRGSIYLFGLRTGFSLFIIPGLLLNYIHDYLYRKKHLSNRTLLCLVFGIGSLFIKWVVTGLIQILVIILLSLLIKLRKDNYKVKIIPFAITILFVNFWMFFKGLEGNFVYFILQMFNKDITLSGRTIIWQIAKNKLIQNWIGGYGSNSTVIIGEVEKSVHNQWFHIAMESGIVGLAIFIVSIISTCWFLYEHRNMGWYNTYAIFVIALLVGSITEIQIYVPFFYAVFEIPYQLVKMRMFISREEKRKKYVGYFVPIRESQ